MIVGAGAVLVLGAQAFPIARTNPPVAGDVGAPADVGPLLRRTCYDCHSHETVWPWYSRIAPVSWLLAHDVGEGRRELNFSTWESYAPAKRRKLLRESAEELAEGAMPPWSYALVHPEARLTADERVRLEAWARNAGAVTPQAR
jgi:hypothetical protein